jgi:hypothetical protein
VTRPTGTARSSAASVALAAVVVLAVLPGAQAHAETTGSAAPAPAATAGAAAKATDQGGTVRVRERTFDAGAVERGKTIEHSFVLENVGRHDLVVDAKPG